MRENNGFITGLTRILALGAILLILQTGVAAAQPIPSPKEDTLSTTNLKTVEVSREFQPTIQGAEKYYFLPKLDDSVQPSPQFEYALFQRPVHSQFPVKSIPLARMGKEPLEDISPFYIKLGYGNYISPMLEAYYSGRRSKSFTYGGQITHNSSWGKLRLADDEEVTAPVSHTRVGLYGDAVRGMIALHGKFSYNHHYDSFYGRRSDSMQDANPLFEQVTSSHIISGLFSMNSLYVDSAHFQYDARGGIDGYFDSRDMKQARMYLEAQGHKYFTHECFGAKIALSHYQKSMTPEVANNTIFSLAPWVKIFGDRWRAWGGVDMTVDHNNGETFLHFFPRAHLSYDIIKHYFIPYFELDGGLDMADYQTIRRENPWIQPGLLVWNTPTFLEMRGGIKGNLTSKSSYNIAASYALHDSMHFYVNERIYDEAQDKNLAFRSPFGVVYDNGQVLHCVAEFQYHLGLRYNLHLRADYWHYSLSNLEQPWHKPALRGTFAINYNLRNKIYAGLDLFVEGGQKARGLEGEVLNLGVLPDLNVNLRYRYSEMLSFFLDMRNLLFQKHDIYYLYPMHRFNARLGLILNF